MTHLIDKDALIAEIERLVNNHDKALDYEAALEDVRNFIDTLEVKEVEEAPVSEDLEKAMQHNAPNNIGIDDLLYWRNGFIAGAKWQKEKEYTCYEEAFEDGAKWKVENLWKPADDDDLPEIDREVIALLDNGKVVFAHRPPEYWDGKNIATGKVIRYYPKTYDKGGWNIPNVKYWLDIELPKEIEL